MVGHITVVGAGELMPAMSRMHRYVIERVGKPVQPVFLDTTAGYETNVAEIAQKAVEYYRHRLQTTLEVASFRHRDKVSELDVARAVATLKRANLIFAGPGSPSYTIHHLRDTSVWRTVQERFVNGAHLLFASAASISLGRYALPVYEIYKAGHDPFWLDGLDVFGLLGMELAIVPHFDNNSGGENYDTRCCYIGAERFSSLRRLLPNSTVIVGIDEYTALHFDIDQQAAHVTGKGNVTLIHGGHERVFPHKTSIPFSDFLATDSVFENELSARGHKDEIIPAADPFTALVHEIQRLDRLDQADKVRLLTHVEDWHRASNTPGATDVEAPLINLLLDLRVELRRQKQWVFADMIRSQLGDLGYQINDTSEGYTWRRKTDLST